MVTLESLKPFIVYFVMIIVYYFTFINIEFHLPLLWPNDLAVKLGLQLYLFGSCSYSTRDFRFVGKFRYPTGQDLHRYYWHKLEKNRAKYWALWHTTYNVSPVKQFSIYDNAVFFRKANLRITEEFSQLSTWFYLVLFRGLCLTIMVDHSSTTVVPDHSSSSQ